MITHTHKNLNFLPHKFYKCFFVANFALFFFLPSPAERQNIRSTYIFNLLLINCSCNSSSFQSLSKILILRYSFRIYLLLAIYSENIITYPTQFSWSERENHEGQQCFFLLFITNKKPIRYNINKKLTTHRKFVFPTVHL